MSSYCAHSIYVVCDIADAQALVAAARARDGQVLALTLVGVDDRKALERRLLEVFQVPYPSVGIDAATDFAAGLDEWMPSAGGYLLLVTGLDECPADIMRLFVGTLPNIVDRYRSSGHRFEAVLVTRSGRVLVLGILREENIDLDEFGKQPGAAPGTGSVPIYVDGRLDTPFT